MELGVKQLLICPGSQQSAVRSQKSEVGSQKSEDGKWWLQLLQGLQLLRFDNFIPLIVKFSKR